MQTLALLGTGLIGQFYAESLLGGRRRDRIGVVYSHSAERARAFAARYGIPRASDDLAAAIAAPEVGVVVIALPNDRHLEAAELAAAAGKAVLCTKPLGRNADEARAMLAAVERAGVFHGYLEDLVYTPKTLKALQSVAAGSIGKVLWARSREAHGGPHSAWFWDRARSGGGAIVDLGCHCIEIARRFIGGDVRPLEVACWADTLAHPIEAEDHAVGLVRYESGALGQFEVSWAFRGGMDLRDEVTGTEGNDLAQSLAADGVRDVQLRAHGQATWPRRRRLGAAGSSRWGTRADPWATRRCSRTCSTRSRPAGLRRRPSTTAMW